MFGNINYGDYQFQNINMAPLATPQIIEDSFKKDYFNRYNIVDLNNFDSTSDVSLSVPEKRKVSGHWTPEEITRNIQLTLMIPYFNDTENFTSQRTKEPEEKSLQNDFSIFPLGINTAFGVPPLLRPYTTVGSSGTMLVHHI